VGSLRTLLAEEGFTRDLPNDTTTRWREAFLTYAGEVSRA
jgi:hypothetical protein